MATLKRTIHPVGHGAFYTEVFNADTAPQMVVYDCGSQNLTNLNVAIKDFAAANLHPKFEALFVSHFDADHIKGISELFTQFGNPKYVFVPWLDYNHALLEFGKVLTQGLPSSLYYFAYSLILTGRIPGRQQERQQTSQTEVTKLTPSSNNAQSFVSCWEYIPIVHIDTTKQGEANDYRKAMLAAYQASDTDDLIRKIPTDFSKAKEVFKTVVVGEKVHYNFNATSLMLYSGPVKRSTENEINGIPNKTFLCNKISFKVSIPKTKSSAMYLGDIRISPSILNTIYSRIGQKRKEKVGLVQMPHHGAASSHDAVYTTYFESSKIFFCCVRQNDDLHPGNIPMMDVMMARKYLCIIDETEKALEEKVEF